jgi:hypothetical protein
VNTPSLDSFRNAFQVDGNLRLSNDASSPGIVRAGKCAWIKSALGIGSARQANAQTLDALKAALSNDPHYSNASQQIRAMLGEVRVDRPLTGAKIRVLMERADALAAKANREQADVEISRMSTKPNNAMQIMASNVAARAQANPGQEALLNRPEVHRLNDRDFQLVANFAREQLALVKSNLKPEEQVAFFRNALSAAIDELVERRLAIVSAADVEPRLQARLLSRLVDDAKSFSSASAQLDGARQQSAQNAQRRVTNLATAEQRIDSASLREALAPHTLSDAELAVFRETLVKRALSGQNDLAQVEMLSPIDARNAREAFVRETRAMLESDAWAEAGKLRESRPQDGAYLRQQMLRGEKIPAALVAAFPQMVDAIPSLTRLIDSASSLQELHQALTRIGDTLSGLFANLPPGVRADADLQRNLTQYMADVAVARMAARGSDIDREGVTNLLSGGAARALREFVEYHAQHDENPAPAMAFGQMYAAVAQALAHQAGISDADFDRAWNDVPEVSSRLQLPADTHALPVWDAEGHSVESPPSVGNTPFQIPPDEQREGLQHIFSGGGTRAFQGDMAAAAARGYRNPNPGSLFVKDVDRAMHVRLDGESIPNGGDLPASAPETRAQVFYSHLLRFVNPEATLSTASDGELAQMHVLASIINQRLPINLNTAANTDTTTMLLPSRRSDRQDVSVDHVGEDIVLRIDYQAVPNGFMRPDGSVVSLDEDASRQTYCATVTIPRAELARVAAQDWAAAAQTGDEWVNEALPAAPPPPEFRLGVPDDQIRIHSTVVLNRPA